MEVEDNSDESMSYTNDVEKLYELPLSVINALKPVFNLVHPTQLVFQLCTKIKEPFPIYTYSEDDNYKFKCTANLNFGSICVTGYNDQKKEAKKIASEMVILDMIKNKAFRQKIIQVLVKDYNVNPNVFEFKIKKKPNRERMKKENESHSKPLIKLESLHNSFEEGSGSKIINQKRERDEKSSNLSDVLEEKAKPHLSHPLSQIDKDDNDPKIKNEMKPISPNKDIHEPLRGIFHKDNNNKEIQVKPLPSIDKKTEHELPLEFKTEQMQSTLLNFELFCLKWERSLLLDKGTILSVSKFTQNISLIILKLKTRMNIHNSYPIGSYNSSSIRLNYLVIDYLIVLNQDQPLKQGALPQNTIEDFIEYSNPDLTKHDYKIDIIKSDSSYLEIVSKDSIKCKILFSPMDNSNVNTDHLDYLAKKSYTIEQEIALKLIKAWRRSKGLLYLNPMIVEFILLNIIFPLSNQIVIYFFVFLTNLDEESFSQDYQKELIGNLKLSTKYPKIIEEAKMALDVIKNNNFSDLF